MSASEESAVAAASTANQRRGVVSRFVRRAGGTLKSGLALVGLAALAGAYVEYKKLYPAEESEDEKKKKKVLVLPFHRLQLVERKDPTSVPFQNLSSSGDSSDRVLQMEVRELVDLLHHAASDPSITAVYGVFGHGGTGIRTAGWSHLEEIRNALRVVRESHRRHLEPNRSHQIQVIPRVDSKPLYAYADTFSSLGDPANKEYYLASAFTHIHLQQQGELNLFGMLNEQFFLRNLLEKYGVQLHVFKHGQYKNFPNMFTHNSFNRFHLENVKNIQDKINDDVCQEITASRSKGLLTSWLTTKDKTPQDTQTLWKRIHESGTFPAETAWKAGLVDYLPRRDPLVDLVHSNSGGEKDDDTTKEEMEAKWTPQETDFKRFKAEKVVDLKDYAKQVARKKRAAKRRQEWNDFGTTQPGVLQGLISKILPSSESDDKSSSPPKERIALLHVNGAIGDSQARRLMDSIRKIRKDDATKCLVVRVSSPGGSVVACESIAQELKSLDVPVVFSFGNVSASGGYYIAAGADRIFSSAKTVTGSIGIFGIRMDLTGLANKYNVNVETVASGDLAGMYSPFHPMNKKMKKNMAESVDRQYDQFKKLVSTGRNMPLDQVEAVAKGRVWTGEQAKSNGLVDELGGLDRAIAFAQRTYTSTKEEAEVVVWPKKKSLLERLAEAKESSEAAPVLGTAICEWAMNGKSIASDNISPHRVPSVTGGPLDWFLQSPTGIPGTLSGVIMACDENAAIQCLLEGTKEKQQNDTNPLLPDSFWE